MVLITPLGMTSLTRLCTVSATKTSPAESTATPCGSSNPEPTTVSTVGVNRGLVEYRKDAVVVEPVGLTVALSVAPVVLIELGAPVATVGGGRVTNELANAAAVPPELVATTRS